MIDGCANTFNQVVTQQLPAHMDRLRQQMTNPLRMEAFATGKIADCRTQLEETCRDFQGCYVLLDNETPIYTGISRKVLSRLRQHVKGQTHFDASLAYRMAKHGLSGKMHRAKWMLDPSFLRRFKKAQERIREMDVAVIRIDCPVELYLFEMYAAMELDTHLYNSFKTH